jgi:hypothetical protein
MKLKTTAGDVVEIEDRMILAAAGAIYQRRRKTRNGPTKTFPCRYCARECRGHRELEAHQRDCEQNPYSALDLPKLEDLEAFEWPDDSAA